MNEKKRDSGVVVQEFNQIALRAGHVQYEIQMKTNDLKALNETLRTLDTEYLSLKKAEDMVAKAVADSIKPATTEAATNA